MLEHAQRFKVSDLVVDKGARTVQRGQETLRLSGLTFDFFLTLIDAAPNIASFDTLIDQVWKSQTVTPETIAQRASMLRRAIAVDDHSNAYFDAVRGIGYRLLAPVQAPKPVPDATVTGPRTSQTIAVLPFENLSGDPEQEYFCDGLVEDLIGALARVPGLLVISRKASFVYKDKNPGVTELADHLNVNWLLTGSVRRSGNRVRVSVQLTDTNSERLVWSQRLDGTLDDIFDLQDEVSLEIVRSLDIELVSGDSGRHRISKHRTPEMSDALYRGLYNFYQHDPGKIEVAIQQFEECVRIEPDSVLGYAWQATSWAFAMLVGWKSPDVCMPNLKRNADICLSLDPDDPQALVGSAHFLTLTNDISGAIVAAERATKVAPNHEDAVFTLGWAQMFNGDPHSAIANVTRAMRLCPVVTATRFGILGTAYRNAGRYQDSIDTFRTCIGEFPEFVFAYTGLASAHGLSGDMQAAREAVKRALALDPTYTVERFKTPNLYTDKSLLENCASILSQAGMPRAG